MTSYNRNAAPCIWLQLADFAGGSLTCVIGILIALFERLTSVSSRLRNAHNIITVHYNGCVCRSICIHFAQIFVSI